MKPELQRIAIAEACGWKRGKDAKCGEKSWPVWNKGSQSASLYTQTIPNYLNDLNAMHESEKVLLHPDRSKGVSSNPSDHAPLLYDITLMRVVCGDKQNYSPFDYFRRSTATAAQRAEAFLRTLNLWTT